jgi:type I site-specific restriction-modification system R (restriction) subunit
LAFDLIANERSLGREILSQWELVINMEKIRMEALKKAFEMYYQKYIELYGKTNMIEVPMKILESFQPVQDTEKFCSLDQILQPGELDILKRLNPKNNQLNNPNDLKGAIVDFELDAFRDDSLVVKRFSAQKDGGMLKSFEDCEIAITVDEYLLIFLHKNEDEPNAADIELKGAYIKLKPRQDSALIWEVVETKPGFLLDSSHKYVIRFKSSDDHEEFEMAINRLKPGADP